jgi:hypothetical protein
MKSLNETYQCEQAILILKKQTLNFTQNFTISKNPGGSFVIKFICQEPKSGLSLSILDFVFWNSSSEISKAETVR